MATKTLYVRGVHEKIAELLEQRAKQHNRSVNAEVLQILKDTLGDPEDEQRAMIKRLLRRAKNDTGPLITDEQVSRWKRIGREGEEEGDVA